MVSCICLILQEQGRKTTRDNRGMAATPAPLAGKGGCVRRKNAGFRRFCITLETWKQFDNRQKDTRTAFCRRNGRDGNRDSS